jgi:hypothetical protein
VCTYLVDSDALWERLRGCNFLYFDAFFWMMRLIKCFCVDASDQHIMIE